MSDKKSIRWIAGFWKRIGAICLDLTLLMILGLILGLVFESFFVGLGNQGWVVGFFVAFFYFGVMNSEVLEGQTFGKKFFKIRVVNIDGQSINVFRSFIRYSILGVPYFLNNAHFSSLEIGAYLDLVYSFVIVIFMSSVVYLYIFNRDSRQSLHDFAMGTFVVNVNVDRDRDREDVRVTWKAHLYVLCAFLVLSVITPSFLSKATPSESVRMLIKTQSALIDNASVYYATIATGKLVQANSDTITYMRSQIYLKENLVKDADLASRLAVIIIANFSGSKGVDVVQVNLSYGYDIGISSKFANKAYNFDPRIFNSSE